MRSERAKSPGIRRPYELATVENESQGRCQSSSILWRSVRLHDQRVAKREQMSPSNLQAAIQEEQNRLYRFLHDRMSPKIMEMAFLVET